MLRTILEGTATETGAGFFTALVDNLSQALDTHGAWVTEYNEETRRLRALAFWFGKQWIEDYEYDIAGTPCERVIEEGRLVHNRENLLALYPGDLELKEAGAVSSAPRAPRRPRHATHTGGSACADVNSHLCRPRGASWRDLPACTLLGRARDRRAGGQ